MSTATDRLGSVNRRQILKGAGAAGAAAGLGVAPGAPATRRAAAQETVKLRYATNASGASKDAREKIAAEFNATHPGIEVTHEGAPGVQYQDLLKTWLAGGDGADIFFEWGGSQASPYIDAGFVREATPYYEKHQWNTILIPSVVESIKRNGVVWGAPTGARGMGFWYRKDTMAQFNLAEPATYEELETICQTLKSNGIAALSLGGKFGYNTMRLTDYFLEMTAGPVLHDQLTNLEVSWDAPEVVEAYTLLKRWADEEWIVPEFLSVDPGDARIPWYQGTAAMVFEGDWMEGAIKGDEQDVNNFSFFIPPTGHTPHRFSAFPEQYMISASSEYPDQAAEFINWFISPDTQNRYLLELGGSTATIGVEPDPREWPSLTKMRQAVAAAEATYLPADQALMQELYEAFFEVQDAVIAGQSDPEQAARTMQERVEEYQARNE